MSQPTTLQDIEQRLLAEAKKPRPTSYPAEIFPVVTRLHRANISARRIARELQQLPELTGRTYDAIYRRITRHIASLD